MKHPYFKILLLVLSYSCYNSNTPQDLVESSRKEFKKVAEEFNSNNIKQNRLQDSLYKIADSNLDSGIKAIDQVILDYPSHAPYYKIKGDFYFRYHEYQNAIDNYSKALQLESYSNAIVFRASCYLNLRKYDSCLKDLKSFPEYNKENYWYTGNYYEAKQNLDSSIYYYKMLYKEDSVVYKYCKDRIDYLEKQPNPKMFKELNIKDTARLTLQLH